MRVTPFTREILAYRREQRAMLADGWEHVAEPKWELVRGGRWRSHIVDAKPDASGKGVWLKIELRE